MKIHIIGAGPTGMSIAWELKKFTDHEVFMYDKKLSAGGSWWEPSIDTRDMHAHRIVFDRAFINTKSLFKEMDIKWDDIFEKVETDNAGIIREHLSSKDYITLAALAVKVLSMPWIYKKMSLKDAVGELSDKGQKLLEAVTLIIDGVTWDVMTAYEFVKSFDHVGLSSPYTQKVSGKVMCDAMQQALIDKGVHFEFGSELQDVIYLDNGFAAQFKSGMVVKDGLLILCVDNSPALQLMKNNWGEDAIEKIGPSTYGAITIMLEYEEDMDIPSDVQRKLRIGYNRAARLIETMEQAGIVTEMSSNGSREVSRESDRTTRTRPTEGNSYRMGCLMGWKEMAVFTIFGGSEPLWATSVLW